MKGVHPRSRNSRRPSWKGMGENGKKRVATHLHLRIFKANGKRYNLGQQKNANYSSVASVGT